MNATELLEQKIRAAIQTIQTLREKNARLEDDLRKLRQENEMLISENRQVRKLIAELDRLREERRHLRQRCERLLARFDKMKL